MVQRTYYPPAVEEGDVAPRTYNCANQECAGVTKGVRCDACCALTGTLRHGYPMEEIEAAARVAANSALGRYSADWVDVHEAAWFGVVEHLYEADRPLFRDLVAAGMASVGTLVTDILQTRGYFRHKFSEGPCSSPSFAKFWYTGRHQGHESRVVESVAVEQILPQLTSLQRDALLALAVHQNYRHAAEAVGAPYDAFVQRIGLARTRFFALWHEGETPYRPYRTDRRVASYSAAPTTQCRAGHPWTPETTRIQTSVRNGKLKRSRSCLVCAGIREKQRPPRHRPAAASTSA